MYQGFQKVGGLIAFAALLALGYGCVRTPPAEPVTSTATAAAAGTPVPAAPAEPAPGPDEAEEPEIAEDQEAEPELSPEDLESEGFCTDNIYAQYLLNTYRANTPMPKTQVARGRKGRSDPRRAYELAALSWARERMIGVETPYFGAIPVVITERVNFWLQYFKTVGRGQFLRWLSRGESIRPAVEPTLKGVGIPLEFFYLAMIESGFSNNAKSHARATGTWQFMSGTARNYGLRIDHWVDERRDPIKSTIAAANLLKDLYATFGDWHLAMAAYNAGPGKIRGAIRRTGSRDFWKIADSPYISRETAHYVPKMLAALVIASNAKANGFDVQSSPGDAIPETEVLVHRPVRLHEVADLLGVPQPMMEAWNPELIRGVTPPARSAYALRLPRELAARFPAIEPRLSQLEITDVQMHRIQRGETLSRIARQYKVAIRQILEFNPGLQASRLKPGREIAIPIPGVVSTRRAEGGLPPAKAQL